MKRIEECRKGKKDGSVIPPSGTDFSFSFNETPRDDGLNWSVGEPTCRGQDVN
jgi:hypothetical protein